MKGAIVFAVAVLCFWVLMGKPGQDTGASQRSYVSNGDSYQFVNGRVGCGSTFSDEKKKDIFNQDYKDRKMSWIGKIATVSSDSISINIDGKGTQDLQVELANKKGGYHLEKGEMVIVEFVMRRAGGCFLPFSGDLGVTISQ